MEAAINGRVVGIPCRILRFYGGKLATDYRYSRPAIEARSQAALKAVTRLIESDIPSVNPFVCCAYADSAVLCISPTFTWQTITLSDVDGKQGFQIRLVP